MKRIQHLFNLLWIFAIPIWLFSQESTLGNWFIYLGNKPMGRSWNWHSEVQYRNYNAIGDLEQLLLRTGIGFNLTPKNDNILVGYGYIHSRNYFAGQTAKSRTDEYRLFQQYIRSKQYANFLLLHRARFEQRWVNTDLKFRLRYFLSLNLPINQSSMDVGVLYFSAYNEIFLNLRDNFFDRNRLYGGLGYRPTEKLRFEIGYMNQFLTQTIRDQFNLIAFITL